VPVGRQPRGVCSKLRRKYRQGGVRGPRCCCVSCVVMQVTGVVAMHVAVQWCPACPCMVGTSSGLCSTSTCGYLSGDASVVASTAST
jgi:hypothetical protein